MISIDFNFQMAFLYIFQVKMILNSPCLFLASFLFFFSLSFSLEVFIVPDIFSTSLQFSHGDSVIPRPAVLVTNLPVYHIDFLPFGTSQRVSSEANLSFYGNNHRIIQRNQCAFIRPFSKKSIRLFTVLERNLGNVALGFYSSIGETLDYNEKLQLPLFPVYFYERHEPFKTIEEGKRFYEHFESQHLARNLRYFEYRPIDITLISTLPRSGTHVWGGTLEEVYGEWVSYFPWSNEQPEEQDAQFGLMARGNRMKNRIFLQHGRIKLKEIRRFCFSYRDPVEVLDSLFQRPLYYENQKRAINDKLSLKPEFRKEQIFKKWVMDITQHFDVDFFKLHETNVFLLNYNEMVQNPEPVFCEMISFIDRFPCEFSWKGKLKETLSEKGLVSSYKRVDVERRAGSGEDKTTRLYQSYGQALVDRIYSSNYANYIEVFGFYSNYKKAFGIDHPDYQHLDSFYARNGQKDSRVFPYKLLNQWLLDDTLRYLDLFREFGAHVQRKKLFEMTGFRDVLKKVNVKKEDGDKMSRDYQEVKKRQKKIIFSPFFQKYLTKNEH